MLKGHIPVLLNEAVEALNVRAGGKYVDCTFGFGGHTLEILRRGGQVLALDVDDAGYQELAYEQSFEKLTFARDNFRNLGQVLAKVGWDKVDGVLYDLGMSSYQLEESGRGFSFLKEEPLDMRMGQETTVMASDLVNGLSEKELYELFKNFGEDPNARRFASVIASARRVRPLKTTTDLISALGLSDYKIGSQRIHPATRIFQALRIAVNSELESLSVSLPSASDCLEIGGRLVVISFQSLEDRITKDFGKVCEDLRPVDEMILASSCEAVQNPRSRSAKMRIYEKIAV